MKLWLWLFLMILSLSSRAEEIIPFCKEISLTHGYVQFIRIDNSDEFELVQAAKYLHTLKSKTIDKALTQVTFELGSQKKDFIFEHDCQEKRTLKNFNLDDY